ncbi:hypothetical protein ACHAPU_003796 [Fusarium lateritium]
MTDSIHPYFPSDAVIPGYVANVTGVVELIASFGAVVGAVVGAAIVFTKNTQRSIRPIDRFAVAWFALCPVPLSAQLIWGPLSLLTVVGILKDWRCRHVVQVMVCTAHAYSVALYYLTNWNESRMHGVAYSRPEALYFWVYYVGFNLPWAVVPLVLLRDSWQQVSGAFAGLEERKRE